jgi:hypothetical protein
MKHDRDWPISVADARKAPLIMSDPPQRSGSLEVFITAAPLIQRAGLRILLALARRPRGAALIAIAAPMDQLPLGLLTVEHYDDPAVGCSLGWDAAGVLARGRELRAGAGCP